MAKSWKKTEITYLKRYAAKRTLAELGARFGRDIGAVSDKLAELGLLAKDSPKPIEPVEDPMLKVYERALKRLGAGKWAEAAELFARVARDTDQPDLAARARRYHGVCLGKKPRRKKKGAAEDPFLLAVVERNRGNFDAALEICSRGGRQGKDDRFAYLAASIAAVSGDLDKAARHLARAIELEPKNRIRAYHDSDFDELRGDPEHRSLFE